MKAHCCLKLRILNPHVSGRPGFGFIGCLQLVDLTIGPMVTQSCSDHTAKEIPCIQATLVSLQTVAARGPPAEGTLSSVHTVAARAPPADGILLLVGDLDGDLSNRNPLALAERTKKTNQRSRSFDITQCGLLKQQSGCRLGVAGSEVASSCRVPDLPA